MQWWKTVKTPIKKIKEKQNMKWVIFVNNMVYPLLPLPGKRLKNKIKSTKIIAIKNTRPTLLNPMIFMLKGKMFLKSMINKSQVNVNALTMVNLDTSVKIVNKNLVS